MRLKIALAIVLASSNTAMAQDVVVTQLLQRVCFPFMQSDGGSPLSVVDRAARSLNLRLTDESEDRVGSLLVATTKAYSLDQANGTYTLRAVDSRHGNRDCTLTAPGSVSVPHLQQAVTNAVGDEWAVAFTARGPTWSFFDEYEYVDYVTRVTAGLSVSGVPAVWVSMEEYSGDE